MRAADLLSRRGTGVAPRSLRSCPRNSALWEPAQAIPSRRGAARIFSDTVTRPDSGAARAALMIAGSLLSGAGGYYFTQKGSV